MKCTIKDVARKAGVSPSTVSRVISGSARISEETCQRIRKIMDELHYQPNLAARSLVSQSANSVGVFLKSNPEESMKHPFFSDALRALSVKAVEGEMQLVLSFSPHVVEDTNTVRRMIASGAVGAVILLSTQANDPVADYLDRHRIPFVVIGQPDRPDEHWWVDNDNVFAGRMATEHLIKNGHRRIMLLGGNDGYTVTMLRQQGYEEALRSAVIQLNPSWIVNDPRAHSDELKSIFRSSDAPTAVLAMDDSWAIWLMGQLNEWGLTVPKDVSLVGFNNSVFSQYTTPPLTSVEIHPYELGLAAMDMMITVLDKEPGMPTHQIVPVTLVERGSVMHI